MSAAQKVAYSIRREPKRIQTETPRRKRDAELNELRAVGRDSEQIADIEPLRGMETWAE